MRLQRFPNKPKRFSFKHRKLVFPRKIINQILFPHSMNNALNRLAVARLPRYFVVFFAVAFTVFGSACAQKPTKQEITEQILFMTLNQGHYSPIDISDSLPQRTFRLFLKRLDFGKSFLLKSDVDSMRQFLPKFTAELEDGRSPILDLANEILPARTEQVLSYSKEILSKPFDFESDETLQTDPDKRDYPANEAELKELWRKTLKLQTLQRYITLVEERDAPDTVVQSATKTKSLKNAVAAKAIEEPKFRKSDKELEIEAREKVLKQMTDRLSRLEKETDQDRLAQYLEAVASSYDPHTEYFPPKEKEDFDIRMSGTLEGIGATLREQDGNIKVESLVPGGPAWKGKELQPEDIILKVAQGEAEPVDITDMRLDDAVRLIRGRKGTEARLTVKKTDGRIVKISIIRNLVQIEEQFAKSVIIGNDKSDAVYGYINLPAFYADFNRAEGRRCSEDVRKELVKLRAENVNGVILDLRNNGGGSLQDVVRMSGLFIKEGPIVQVGENRTHPEILADRDPSILYDGLLVILVNSFSASASEILSAAMQDYGRAIIVGSKSTFGKGTVQTFIDLNNYLPEEYASFGKLGALKITFQKFYRITGKSTQFRGVTPDIILPDIYEYIPVGERQLDYPLSYDAIPAVTFGEWHGLREQIPMLREKSAARTAANAAFKTVSEQAERMKLRRNETEESLRYAKAKAEQDQLRAESKEYDASRKENKNMITRAPKADPAPVAEQKDKMDDWYKQIRKDIYIAEALAILGDLQVRSNTMNR